LSNVSPVLEDLLEAKPGALLGVSWAVGELRPAEEK
jgi:hypothetical protein